MTLPGCRKDGSALANCAERGEHLRPLGWREPRQHDLGKTLRAAALRLPSILRQLRPAPRLDRTADRTDSDDISEPRQAAWDASVGRLDDGRREDGGIRAPTHLVRADRAIALEEARGPRLGACFIGERRDTTFK